MISVALSITNLYGQESLDQTNIVDNKVNVTSTNNKNNFIHNNYTIDKIYNEFKKKSLNTTIFEDKNRNFINKDTLSAGDNIYIVWSDDTNRINPDIFYKRSTNGGKTFGNTTNISNNRGLSSNVAVAVS